MSDSSPGELTRTHAGVATPPAMQWQAEALWQDLLPLLPGLSVEVVAHISSTNATLVERTRALSDQSADLDDAGNDWGQVRRSVESSAFGRRSVDLQPCLLVAEHQTGGRGRMGRRWQASPGLSLTFSLALPLAPADWSGLSLAVGVALAEALDAAPARPGAPRIGLKWPNDLWLMDEGEFGSPSVKGAGRKLGGILIETVNAPGKRLAVIGVGLNVWPIDAPDVTTGVACVREIQPQAEPPQVLAQVLRPLVLALQQFEREGFAAFAERFADRDVLRGRTVHTTQADARTGVAQGVSSDGSLWLQTEDGQRKAIHSGDVSVRLDAPASDSHFGSLPT